MPGANRFTVDFTGMTLLGHYRVEGKIAAGGMGSVYRAINVTLKKPVVVKVPDPALLGRPGFAERFQFEIEQLVKFNHPNVVSILAAGEHDGVPFFVLDYLEGGSLRDKLDAGGGRQAPNDVLSWLRPIAAALDFLHARRVIHRDVKPGNILFHSVGQPYLSDFGIAKVLEGGPSLTSTGASLYTPTYAAPEQMLDDTGSGALTGAVDQYALASTVYEALGGRPPFPGRTSEIVAGKMRDEVPDLRKYAAHVPAAASMAISRALARRPQDRFPTCAAFAQAFEAGCRPAQTGTRTVAKAKAQTGGQTPIPRARGGRGGRLLVLAVLVLATMGSGGWLLLRKPPAREVLPGAAGVNGGAGEGEAAGPTLPITPHATEVPPKDAAPTPTRPPAPAWEAPLAEALAAMAKDDGDGAKTALAKAVAAGVPAGRVESLQAYVAEWDREPVLTVRTPTSGDAIEAGADGTWQIAVQGTLSTGRKPDRLYVEGHEVAHDDTGAFSFTTTRSTGGDVTLFFEVRHGTHVRARSSVSIALRGFPPPTPSVVPPRLKTLRAPSPSPDPSELTGCQLMAAWPGVVFESPVQVAGANDDSDRIFVLEGGGVLKQLKKYRGAGAPSQPVAVLTLKDLPGLGATDLRALGFALHQRFRDNGRLFVSFATGGALTIAEFDLSAMPAVRAKSPPILTIPSIEGAPPSGGIAFGPDGMLYVGCGADPQLGAQDIRTLRGKILRLDVDGGRPFKVPADNPWADGREGVRPELFAYGLRDPRRLAWDDQTKRLWVMDADSDGQVAWTWLIDLVRAGNHGWPRHHGTGVDEGIPVSPLAIPPIFEHVVRSTKTDVSPVGGVLYRGQRIPSLRGHFVFANPGHDELYAVELLDKHPGVRAGEVRRIAPAAGVTSIDVDRQGELYVSSRFGDVWTVVAGP